MKKFRTFMFTAAVCLSAAPFLTSCDDITDDSLPVDGSGMAGTYKLSGYAINDEDFANPGTYIAAEADINGDGTASHDLTAESPCYGESTITFNRNHTYSRTYSYSDGATGCLTAMREVGVWSREGDVITMTSSDTNGAEDGMGMEIFTQEFTVSGNTLTGSREEVDNFVGTGFGTGKIDFTFTKVTE